LTLDQVSIVEKRQGVQHRQQHLARFVLRQGAVFQQLRELLVGILHHNIGERLPTEVKLTSIQELHQVRVRQIGGRLPAREQQLGEGRMCRYELDGNFGWLATRDLGEEHRTLIRAAEKTMQRILAID
jgi:hypothetical protein